MNTFSDAWMGDNTIAGMPGTKMLSQTEQLCVPAVEGLREEDR